MPRSYDLVLFGATGFTGGLTADYLAAHVPAGTRWAVAGRNAAKLEAVRERLKAIAPASSAPDLLHADATDPASIRAVAEATRVVATTVGPYILHGEPLVAACAAAGTDYLDLTGEPEFVDAMWLAHHASAEASGARLVHCCGFDSVPHDLGAQFTVEQLPTAGPVAVRGFVASTGTLSAGTFHSAVTAFGRARSMARAAKQRKLKEPAPTGRRARQVTTRPYGEPAIGKWAIPLPTIDGTVVVRSARALPAYGPDFTYSHNAAVKRIATALAAVVGLAGLFAAAQIPPLRRFVLGRMASGEGPDADRRARSTFAVTFVGEAAGQRVVTRVSGGDPGYGETAKMLAEATLCLAHDELPPTAGQVTTATAMGTALRHRLQRAGMVFEVLEPPHRL